MGKLFENRNGKRLLSLAMTLVLFGGLFTGCAAESNPKGESKTAEISSEEQQEASRNTEVQREGGLTPMFRDEENTIQAKQLETDTRICIDYSIGSYASVQNFSYELLSQNLEETNPVLSPVSAYLAISMAGLGAEGETLEEFRTVLDSDMMCLQDDLMNRLPQDEENLQVAIANSAWLNDDLTVKEHWLANVYSFYDADVYQTKLAAEEAKEDINLWVKQNTEGLIPEFLTEALTPDIELVLFNTVYFQGKWACPFEAYNTKEREFTLDDGEVVMVDTMRIPCIMPQYFQNDLAEGVVLSYRGASYPYSFIAVRPAEELTVRELYDRITMEGLMELIETGTPTWVDLQLPKFEITFDQILNDSLQNMGLRRAFEASQADFTGISNNPLYISQVRQKAVFRLDEEGAEASAATEVELARGGVPEGLRNMYFDKPFLYMIIENETKVPLFMGIMDNPAKAQGE